MKFNTTIVIFAVAMLGVLPPVWGKNLRVRPLTKDTPTSVESFLGDTGPRLAKNPHALDSSANKLPLMESFEKDIPTTVELDFVAGGEFDPLTKDPPALEVQANGGEERVTANDKGLWRSNLKARLTAKALEAEAVRGVRLDHAHQEGSSSVSDDGGRRRLGSSSKKKKNRGSPKKKSSNGKKKKKSSESYSDDFDSESYSDDFDNEDEQGGSERREGTTIAGTSKGEQRRRCRNGRTREGKKCKAASGNGDVRSRWRSAGGRVVKKNGGIKTALKAISVTIQRLRDPLNPVPEASEELLDSADLAELNKLSIEVARDYAETAKEQVDNISGKVASAVGGKLAKVGPKTVESIYGKLNGRVGSERYKGNPVTLKDIARNTIVVKDKDALEKAQKEVRKLAKDSYNKLPPKVREGLQAKAKIARDMDKIEKEGKDEIKRLREKAKDLIYGHKDKAKVEKELEEKIKEIEERVKKGFGAKEKELKKTKKRVEESWKEIEDLQKKVDSMKAGAEKDKKLDELKRKKADKEELLQRKGDYDAIFMKEKDPKKYDGYSDTTFQIPIGVSEDGGAIMYAEIQINTPQMMWVKSKPSTVKKILGEEGFEALDKAMKAAGLGENAGRGHAIYDDVRVGNGDLKELKKESQKLYGDARKVDLSGVKLWKEDKSKSSREKELDDKPKEENSQRSRLPKLVNAKRNVKEKEEGVSSAEEKVDKVRVKLPEIEQRLKKVEKEYKKHWVHRMRRLELSKEEKRKKLLKLGKKLVKEKKELEGKLEEAEAELEEAEKDLEEAEKVLEHEREAAQQRLGELVDELEELVDELEELEEKENKFTQKMEKANEFKEKLGEKVEGKMKDMKKMQEELEELKDLLG